MVKIDLKDRKILYELDNYSRQSLSNIGKKVGLHKNVVLYRIKRPSRANLLAVKKPGLGIPAERLHELFGRRLRRRVAADQLLHEDDLEEGAEQ